MNGFSDIFAPDVNYVPARSVYPSASGPTLGSVSSAYSPDAATYGGGSDGPDAMASATGAATPSGPLGHPVAWWFALVAIFAAFVFVGRKVGQAEEFKNVRFNAYNIIGITLAAVIGITLLKLGAAKFRVKGLSDVILAA